MTLVVLSAYPYRLTKFGSDWPTYTVYNPGLIGKREAHLALAGEAVLRGWDESVHVIQDDVTDPARFVHAGEVTSYWQDFNPDHYCPKSFTATHTGWQELARVWSRPGKTCDLWKPDYRSTVHGLTPNN